MKKRGLESKVLSAEELADRLPELRSKKKVVFTNGCFDLLHRGHVSYLEEASERGDLLIVALNSDPSVKRLKGESRPVHSLEDRLRVLAALESVDYVTWFEEDTPVSLLKKLKPDLLVKGGDYSSEEEVVGWEEVKKAGGEVAVLRLIPGRSTTETLKKTTL